MAPEHPVPAALDNVEDAVNSVMARPEKFDLTRLSIPGFSADANLALAASANLQPISLRQVPILDLSFYLMIDLNIDPCAKSTLASTQNLQCLCDPRTSCSFAQLVRFPRRILMITAEWDTLALEAEELAERLRQLPPAGMSHSLIMGLRTVFKLGILGLAAAESSVVSLYLWDADPQPLAASVVAATASKTTYRINCASSVESKECELGPGFMYTASPSTVEWMIGAPYNIGPDVCSMKGTLTAVCTVAVPTETSARTLTSTLHKTAVTVTAGPSVTMAQASATDAGAEGSTTFHTSDVLSDASTAPVSTGGLPQITARAGLALGAAVALVAGGL
ncbi:hypothetical protein N7499_004376 [Penicillium canescens]|nr:uncharacterized protein N7446_005330 [Penicillium canescens]KAJ6039414.1 hypothetical protein N7444_008319 [Penicillium canescens]KAJ6068293.1 hypothetical protein N7446_005330 [Penicillium canescens]KAJ6084747.1 hypothetical protein N7499_004376 [Penicillium canescens]KAJ6161533.1 hypothetical protein N7485_009763 [Penicillium canescens]